MRIFLPGKTERQNGSVLLRTLITCAALTLAASAILLVCAQAFTYSAKSLEKAQSFVEQRNERAKAFLKEW